MSSLGAFKTALEGLIWPSCQLKYKSKNGVSIKLHDPLSTMVRLALVSFKPAGTKVNILSYKLSYRPPHSQQAYLIYYPIQDDYRWSQEEFGLLEEPILKAAKLYCMNKDPSLHRIFEFTLLGLKALLTTYQKRSKEVSDILTSFITSIDSALNLKMPKIKEKDAQDEKIENFFHSLWTKEEVYAIDRLLAIAQRRNIEKAKDKKAKKISASFDSTINAIEVMLQDKDNQLMRYLRTI